MSRNLIALSVTAGLVAGTAMAEVPRVAVDIAPVHSLVARVMDGVGDPDLIVTPGASPHEYSLRPSQARALQDADLVFWMGEELTPWMDGALDALSDEAQVTSLLDLEGTHTLPFREGALFEAHDHGDETEAHHGHEDADGHEEDGHEDEGHEDDAHDHDAHAEEDHDHDKHDSDHEAEHHEAHDHEEKHHEDEDHEAHGHEDAHYEEDHHDGHAHEGVDPHAWLSPENAALWLNAIAAALSAADPENAGAYYANASAGRAELDALTQEVAGILEPVQGRNFIVFHDAYQYFEEAFAFPAAGAISMSDASDPSPARIAEIQGRVAEQNVTCVLSEPQFAPGIVAAVMDGSAARTATLDPLGSGFTPGPALYPQLIRNLALKLAECL